MQGSLLIIAQKEKRMTEKMNQDPAWTYDTICRGIVTQFDVPGILRELEQE